MPVVVLPGKPPMPGFNASDLAAAIGVSTQAKTLPLTRVWKSLDDVLAAVLRAAAQLNDADLDLRIPNRDRDLRELIHDVFYKAMTWAPETGPAVPRSAGSQRAEAARCRDVQSLLRYGNATRASLRARFGRSDEDGTRIIQTADGPLPVAAAVGWLADHSAHHLRQIYWLMDHRLRVTPDDPLDPASLPGVSLQEQLW